MKRKSLYDISWQVDEPTYRDDPALSYSTIARFDREGFEKLDQLNDKVSTPSLTFGSAVDTLITGTNEEFQNRFTIAELPHISPSVQAIIQTLYEVYGKLYKSLEIIPSEAIESAITVANYQPRWSMAKKIEYVMEGAPYYSFLEKSDGKEVLSMQLYNEVERAVLALKNSEATQWYFKETNEPNLERLYQLKFKATLNDIDYRIMADELIVDHDAKIIIPIDLKTSSHKEFDFYKSFVKWKYYMQAILYSRVIKHVCSQDEYFKDFEILPYRFIVVNKESCNPLVWEFNIPPTLGTIVTGKNNCIEMHDPEVIGRELYQYLQEKPKVPHGIDLTGKNDIMYWLENYEN